MAEAPDINVDELRRRARRRLVGAIVLALAAAVFVPMLLESDPKPLGEDVSVKIPPVDDGKFVNRLSDKGAKPRSASDAAKGETAKERGEGSAEGASKESTKEDGEGGTAAGRLRRLRPRPQHRPPRGAVHRRQQRPPRRNRSRRPSKRCWDRARRARPRPRQRAAPPTSPRRRRRQRRRRPAPQPEATPASADARQGRLFGAARRVCRRQGRQRAGQQVEEGRLTPHIRSR